MASRVTGADQLVSGSQVLYLETRTSRSGILDVFDKPFVP